MTTIKASVNTPNKIIPKSVTLKDDTLTLATLGIENVDNTSDVNKPISVFTQAALDLKANTADLTTHTSSTSNPHNVTKVQLNLGNVDNTSDADKPISTAVQAALNTKISSTSVYSRTEIDQKFTDLVNGSPTTLDTLNELADALNNDVAFSTTVTNQIGLKAPLDSPNFTNYINVAGYITATTDVTAGGNISATGNITSGALTTTSKLLATSGGNGQDSASTTSAITVDVTDGGLSPALTAIMQLKGYEGRGAGIFIQDSVNSATDPSDRQWFIGTGYGQSNFNIGYAADAVQTSYAANNQLTIQPDGDVGIRTNFPRGDLHVVGKTDSAGRIYVSDQDTGTEVTDSFMLMQTGTNSYITNRADGKLILGREAGDVITISTANNVGIGTPNPARLLTVYEDTSADSIIQIKVSDNQYASRIDFGDPELDNAGRINYEHSNNNLSFFTDNSNRMSIDGSGNVGIGVTSPSTKLEVVDDMAVIGDTPSILLRKTPADNTHEITRLTIGTDNSLAAFEIQTRDSSNSFVSNDYRILKDSSGATSHRFAIANSNKLEVTSTGAAITGNATVSGDITTTGGSFIGAFNGSLGSSASAVTANVGDSSNAVSTTQFVTRAIDNLLASAPGTLDTLNELAIALGNDPNFASTIVDAIALKAPIANPTFTGTLQTANVIEKSNDTLIGTALVIKGGGANAANIEIDDASSNQYIHYDAAKHVFRSRDGTTVNDLLILDAAVDRAFIGEALTIGKLSGGTHQLTLTGTNYGGSRRGILMEHNASADGEQLGEITFYNTNNANTGSNDDITVAKIDVSVESTSGNAADDSGAHILFRTKDIAGPITPRMAIRSNGKVGIGKTAPAKELDVVGDVEMSGRLTDVISRDGRFESLNPGNRASLSSRAMNSGTYRQLLTYTPPYLQEESTDDVNYTTSTQLTENELKDLMLGEGMSTSHKEILPNNATTSAAGNAYYRLTWDAADTGYVFLNSMLLYGSFKSDSIDVKVEVQYHGSTDWQLVAQTDPDLGMQPGVAYVDFLFGQLNYLRMRDQANYLKYLRVTFHRDEFDSTQSIQLNTLNFYGSYPYGNSLPYRYNRDGKFITKKDLQVTSGYNFIVDTDLIFADGSTNRVGFGTDTPDGNAKVHVAGKLRTDGPDLYLYNHSRAGGTAGSAELHNGRALVHDTGDTLTINYSGDYTGGVKFGNGFYFRNAGAAGINAEPSGNFKLDVNGLVRLRDNVKLGSDSVLNDTNDPNCALEVGGKVLIHGEPSDLDVGEVDGGSRKTYLKFNRIDSNTTGGGTDHAVIYAENTASDFGRLVFQVMDNGNTSEKFIFRSGRTSGTPDAFYDILHFYNDNATANRPRVGIGLDSFANDSTNILGTDNVLHLRSDEDVCEIAIQTSKATNSSSRSEILFGSSTDVDVGKLSYLHNDDAMVFRTQGADKMRLHAGGDLSLGSETANAKLHVEGGVYTETVNYGSNQDGTYLIAGTNNWTGATDGNWGNYGFQHKFKSSSGGVPRITIDSKDTEIICFRENGRVGIGTAGPDEALHVVGDIKVSDDLHVLNNIDVANNAQIDGTLRTTGAVQIDVAGGGEVLKITGDATADSNNYDIVFGNDTYNYKFRYEGTGSGINNKLKIKSSNDGSPHTLFETTQTGSDLIFAANNIAVDSDSQARLKFRKIGLNGLDASTNMYNVTNGGFDYLALGDTAQSVTGMSIVGAANSLGNIAFNDGGGTFGGLITYNHEAEQFLFGCNGEGWPNNNEAFNTLAIGSNGIAVLATGDVGNKVETITKALEVYGDGEVTGDFEAGQLKQAISGNGNTKEDVIACVAAGNCTALGTSAKIKGATVSLDTTGVYDITFSNARANSTYVVNVTAENSSLPMIATISDRATTGFKVRIFSAGGVATSKAFSFSVFDF